MIACTRTSSAMPLWHLHITISQLLRCLYLWHMPAVAHAKFAMPFWHTQIRFDNSVGTHACFGMLPFVLLCMSDSSVQNHHQSQPQPRLISLHFLQSIPSLTMMMTGRKLQRTPSADQAAAAAAAASARADPPAAAAIVPAGSGGGVQSSGGVVHVSQRYPNLTGRVLQDQVFTDWTLPKCEGITSPWYPSTGDRERALVRSATNKARAMNMTSVEEYAEKM